MFKAEHWTAVTASVVRAPADVAVVGGDATADSKSELRRAIRHNRKKRSRGRQEASLMLDAWNQAVNALAPRSHQWFAALFVPTPLEPDLSRVIEQEVTNGYALFPVIVDAKGSPLSEPAWAFATKDTIWVRPNSLWPAQPQVQTSLAPQTWPDVRTRPDAVAQPDVRTQPDAMTPLNGVAQSGTKMRPRLEKDEHSSHSAKPHVPHSTVDAGIAPQCSSVLTPNDPQCSSVLTSAALKHASIILVAALAVAADGTRLGQGGGWYDRTLQHAHAPIVAACFDDEMFDHLQAEKHDVPVDGVITPSGFFTCQ